MPAPIARTDLAAFLAQQYELQARLNTWERIRDDDASRQQFVNQMLLAMHEETVEVMRETAYKNPDMVPFGWKHGQHWNPTKLKEELVDVFHVWLALAITAGLSAEEIADIYAEKHAVNCARQESGY